MLKPNGSSAHNVESLMLLHLWAHHLNQEEKSTSYPVVFAALGKPSYYLDEAVARSALDYWQYYATTTAQLQKQLIESPSLSAYEQCDTIAQAGAAIDYGLPAGEREAKTMMAQALSNWYNHEIVAEEIIFTVGGLSALKMIFHIVNAKRPRGRIITPSPYYPCYNVAVHQNNLFFIDVMEEPGYRLTARALAHTIHEANRLAAHDGNGISAFLFCNPNNPTGTVISFDEWVEIAAVLKTTSADIPIIIDEAYAEMAFEGKPASILEVAPELKDRLIILRSATKSLSASGERMAVVLCSNEAWREALLDEILLSYIHLPKSLQYAYAQALLQFSSDKQKGLAHFYQLQSEYVQERLKKMNAALPDCSYKPEGTFYVLADLSRLLGTTMPPAAARALGKTGTIETDVDICYSLLFQDRIAIAPLSYFGVDPKKGFVRITCSGGITQLAELMDRLENRLR